jgi:hypothetical protein
MTKHQILSAFGITLATVCPVVALQYQGNWKVAIGCLAASTFLNVLGFTAVKPLIQKGGDQ